MYFFFPGILNKWQLIFYGTATNPISIRSRQFNPVQQQTHFSPYNPSSALSSSLPHVHSLAAERHVSNIFDFFQPYAFQNYQGPYTGAASNVQSSVASLDGSPAPILTNRLPGNSDSIDDINRSLQGSLDPSRTVLHNCDPQCDHQGCYGPGPTECIACKAYRLDKCV